jgi:uncharacterized membrane protein YobD (UPF0266 family)
MTNLSNTPSISWQADEFKYYPKNIGWYVTVVCVTILIVAFFIIVQEDIFAAASLGIVGILTILFARHKPSRVQIKLDERGIYFDKLFYPYKQIKYFWVVHNTRHQTINLHTSALINNVVILELENQDPEVIRKFLIQHIPEHPETQETQIQKIMHKFKF